MEALYQEAGRAGRDLQNADCFVFLMLTPNLEDIFSPQATLDDLINWQSNLRRGSQEIFHSNSSCLLGSSKMSETNECQI